MTKMYDEICQIIQNERNKLDKKRIATYVFILFFGIGFVVAACLFSLAEDTTNIELKDKYNGIASTITLLLVPYILLVLLISFLVGRSRDKKAYKDTTYLGKVKKALGKKELYNKCLMEGLILEIEKKTEAIRNNFKNIFDFIKFIFSTLLVAYIFENWEGYSKYEANEMVLLLTLFIIGVFLILMYLQSERVYSYNKVKNVLLDMMYETDKEEFKSSKSLQGELKTIYF